MVAAMRHRGPDDRGLYHDNASCLGMTRLSILDVTPAGHQPMSNADETVWIVYNGETYNFQSQRERLVSLGHTFRSTSDTEVVLRMYEQDGDDFLTRLRGIFALAVYDRRRGPGRERLLLARDPLGVKPLLYARTGGRLVFASEMKALLAGGLVAREIDPAALRLLLTYGSVYQPRTMLQGVRMLPPAHCMVVERDTQRVQRYASLEVDRLPELQAQPYEAQVERLAHALEETLARQMVSDVPLGAFLSGGVDSSLLVALMAKSAGGRIQTFSVGFDAEGAPIDESSDAERTAALLGTDHHHVRVRGQDVADRIGHIARALDQPSVDGVNSYFVSRAAKQCVTVAISGTGGDELFAGYPWFLNMVLDRRQARQAPWSEAIRRCVARWARLRVLDPLMTTRAGPRLTGWRNGGGFRARYANNYNVFGSLVAARVLSGNLRRAAHAGRSTDDDLAPIDELSGGTTVQRVTGLCLRGYTNNQLLRDIDAVSMAHSLEVRVPFLDPELVAMALSLPDSAKIADELPPGVGPESTYRETGAKRILIDAGRPLLPEGIDRQSKRGFGMPFDAWLRGPLHDTFRDTLSRRSVRQRGLLDVPETMLVKQQYLAGHVSWERPWLLMMLELWCREVLDCRPGRLNQEKYGP